MKIEKSAAIEPLRTLFSTYNALGRVSTQLPHQFSQDGEFKQSLSTTLLTPDGLGISLYDQRHTRTNFGKERKERYARRIILCSPMTKSLLKIIIPLH